MAHHYYSASGWLLIVSSCFATAGDVLAGDNDAKSYESAVASLPEGTRRKTVDAAVRLLEDARTKAFPVLIAHRDDKRRAASWFQEDREGEPTVGDVCFDIIQREVEGVWPKAYRDYHFLTRESLPAWWKARERNPLHELRLEAARSSLERARKAYEKDKSNWTQETVKFLTEHLHEVERN
jgi:hypothetical protein